MENDDVKLLWDFNIRTDRVIEARRPEIVQIDKKNKETLIVVFRVKENEIEKITLFQELVIEINRMWDTNSKMIPIVIGALGAQNQLIECLALLGVQTRKAESMQQSYCGGD